MITAAVRADRMLVARCGGEVVGVCGCYQDGHGAVDVSWRDLRSYLSRVGAVRAWGVLSVLAHRDKPDVLTLDGICVAQGHRGRGIGSILLDAATERARHRGQQAVQLSVIETNPRAAVLYRRHGFIATDRGSLGPLRHLYGFDRYTTMRKPIRS